MSKIEKRFFAGMELRFTDDGAGAPKLGGYIAVFNSLSEDFGGWREKIVPGAFTDTIARDDIRGIWNHNSDMVLGRLSSGTLRLTEDDQGLAFENDPPDTTWFKDRAISLKRKDVTGSSFGFYDETDENDMWGVEDGVAIRYLRKVRLIEVSPGVTFPAYPQTDVAVRSLQHWREDCLKREAEKSGKEKADLVDMELRNKRLRLQALAL